MDAIFNSGGDTAHDDRFMMNAVTASRQTRLQDTNKS